MTVMSSLFFTHSPEFLDTSLTAINKLQHHQTGNSIY